MENFTKVVRIGTIPHWDEGRPLHVYFKIAFAAGRLSITGVEGPLMSGNCLGGCGQIGMDLRAPEGLRGYIPAPGWSLELVKRVLELWDRWHHNDMKAGTPAQEAYLRANPIKAIYPESHYMKAKAALAEAGLEPDNGYSYGSKWLHEEVPEDVLEELRALPDTDRRPAWV